MSIVEQPSDVEGGRALYRSRSVACAIVFVAIAIVFSAFAKTLVSAEAMHHASGWKLATFVPSGKQPNILLLGSSLTLISAVRADSQAETGHTIIDEDTCFENLNYDKAQYLTNKLHTFGVEDVETLNMSLIASMASDYLKIFTLLDAGKYKPEILVCGIAPRDFVCLRHGANFPASTYAQTQLTYIANTFPEIAFGKKLYCEALTNLIAEYHFKAHAGWEALKSCATVKTLAVVARVVKNSPLSSNFAEGVLDGWAKAPLTYKYAPAFGPRANTFSDVEQYKTYYQPPNWSGYDLQKGAFETLLKLARSKNVQVVIVNMPLTKTNLALLDQNLLNAYRKDIATLTHKYDAAYLDLQDSNNFVDSDFEDSVHLNEFGGQKLFDALAEKIADDSLHSPGLLADDSLHSPGLLADDTSIESQ